MNSKGIYHNGQTAQAYDCELVLSGESLYIYFMKDDSKTLLIWNLKTIHSCHLNGNHLIIKNGGYPHETLECTGEIAKKVYTTWAQNSVVRKAEGMLFNKNGMLILSLCVGFLAVCVFAYFWLLPWVGERSAILVPIEVEIRMGDELNNIYVDESGANDSASYFANEFVKGMQVTTDYPLQVQVVRSNEINAFALPGGHIVVYTGILEKMDSYEEFAALLGHEITHVTNRHSLRSILRTAASSVLIATLFGDISGVSSAVLQQADEFKQLDYSRELETEADNNGLDLMVRNKVNPEGMVKLLEILKVEAMEMPAMMKYLSSHPETQARIDNIKANPQMKNEFPVNTDLKIAFERLQRNL